MTEKTWEDAVRGLTADTQYRYFVVTYWHDECFILLAFILFRENGDMDYMNALVNELSKQVSSLC